MKSLLSCSPPRAGAFYFSRKHLHELTSHLQAVVDELSRDAANVPGGLFVLGSIHTELVALLEDRDAHVERFLEAHAGYRGWEIERVAIAPTLDAKARAAVEAAGYLAQDLGDLTAGL